MPFFGFIPSTELLQTIQTAQQKKDSSEPLYPLRDKTALLINDEIIDAILTELVRRFPPSDKRDTAEKLAGYIKSTVAVLLKQLPNPLPLRQKLPLQQLLLPLQVIQQLPQHLPRARLTQVSLMLQPLQV